MTTICMYSDQLYLAGGIESVIRELYKILPDNGFKIVAVCEEGSPTWINADDYALLPINMKDRSAAWKKILEEHNPECVVFHHIARDKAALIIDDIATIKGRDVRCVHFIHAAFPTPLLIQGDELFYREIEAIAKVCDAVFTVSEIDAKWWASLGYRAINLQNPIRLDLHRTVLNGGALENDSLVNIIWVGRNTEVKGPWPALYAFAGAYKNCPNIRLTMIGGSDAEWMSFKKKAKRLGVAEVVEFLSARDNISDLWVKTDIHLVTSLTESFCLVLAEAKSHGIPTIMFKIPYIELACSREGIINVDQGDVDAMARNIVILAQDRQRRRDLGLKARESLLGFNTEKVVKDWERAIEALRTGKGFAIPSKEMVAVVPQIVYAWNRFCSENLWLIKFERELEKLSFNVFSLKIFAKIINYVFRLAQRLKYLILSA